MFRVVGNRESNASASDSGLEVADPFVGVRKCEFDNEAFGVGSCPRRAELDGQRASPWQSWKHSQVESRDQGELLLTLGTKGEAGEWNESTGSHHFNQPNDVAIAANGDVFVVQGHTPGGGDPRVLHFDRNGKFLATWGGRGKEPGKFEVAHGIAIDPKGLLWVTDRENQRIQIFNPDGSFVRELHYAGLPCAIDIGPQYIYMVNGFAAQLLRLDLNGQVLATTGKPGKGAGEFGEAHMLAVSPSGDVYVADSVNGTLQKFVRTAGSR